MISKDMMDFFVEKFKYCYELDTKWNERLFKAKNSENLTDLFFERSKEFREAFSVNEEIINELKLDIHDDITPEEADILYDALMGLYYDGYDDFVVLEIVFAPLTNYYRKCQDLNKLIPLLHAYAYEESRFYLESNIKNNMEALRYYYEIFSYSDKYDKITDKSARMCFFKAYCNILASSAELLKTDCMQYFQIRKRALGLWYSKIVQRLDGNDPDFFYFIDRISASIFEVDTLEELPLNALEIIRVSLKKYDESKKENPFLSDSTNSIRNKLDYYDKKISLTEFMNKLIVLYEGNAKLFSENYLEDEGAIDYLEACDAAMRDITSYFDDSLSKKQKDKIISLVYHHKRLLSNLPYNYYPMEINTMIYEFYEASYSLLKSFNDKLDYILEDLMFRQTVTCIHSIMVKNISFDIAEAVMEKRPELYVGVLDTKSKDEVIERKDEILDFVSKAALLHDIGKFTCADIINTQSRRLDDKEFRIIKSHPSNARILLSNDKDFDNYYDIMEGHHKYYDGSFGYPMEFDNTKSKNRFVIDIVSIADSTDAATDILGRNYTTGKLFIDLLEELKREAGVRYNPDIIDLISDDLALIDKLSKETTKGRVKVYEQVYHKYISKNN